MILGYRKYAKDYEIEYVDRIGKKRPDAVRIYVGPYFKFASSAEKIAKLRWQYLAFAVIAAITLFVPLCINCGATRTWYVQVPAVMAWIPLILAGCAVSRIWTAKEKVEREHYDMMYQRMNGSSLFMVILGGISFIASVIYVTRDGAFIDFLISDCYLIFTVCGILMFAKRKSLEMTEVQNPEKPKAKNK